MIKRLYWLMLLFLVATDAIARPRPGGPYYDVAQQGYSDWTLFLLGLLVIFGLPVMVILAIIHRRKIATGFIYLIGLMKVVWGKASRR